MPADALQSAACFSASEFMTFKFVANLWGTVEASPTPFPAPRHLRKREAPGCMRRYLQGSVQVFWQPGGWRSHSRPEGEDDVTADWVSRADSRRNGWRETSCSTVSSHSLIDFGFADVHKDNGRLRLCRRYWNFTCIWAFKQHRKTAKIFAMVLITNGRIEAEPLCLFSC